MRGRWVYPSLRVYLMPPVRHCMSATNCAGRSNPQVRILFVDDDELMPLSSSETLEDLGYATATAATGSAALKYLHAGGQVDVLITDIGLPDIPGMVLAAQVRALRPNVRVIFATGYDKPRAIDAATEPHTSFLAKPFTPAALAQAISGALAEGGR